MTRWTPILALALVAPLMFLGCEDGSPDHPADVTPYEVLLTIQYGAGPGMLDTTRVDTDDPDRSLVQSFRVEDDGTVWLFPRCEVAEGRALLRYRDGAFLEALGFRGYCTDFLLTPSGVYSWGQSPVAGITEVFAFDPGPGDGEVRYTELPEPEGSRRYVAGRLQVVDGEPCLVFLDGDGGPSTLRVGTGLPKARLSRDQDITAGVMTPGGNVWQNGRLIMLGDHPIADLGREEGTLTWVFPEGGFVIRRPGLIEDRIFYPVFEVYDGDGMFKRIVISLPIGLGFGAGTSSWYFTPQHVYQLRLNATNGQVLRY